MANTGNTQQIIDYGATANDGQGDPLRTAFIKTDENFSNIWAAGPVGSNITIVNNTIGVQNTNGNLILAPNGVGVIESRNSILPWIDSVYDLGDPAHYWRNIYASGIASDSLTISGDLSVGGNLTVAGNVIEMGQVITDALTLHLGNTATTESQANGGGITLGANYDIANILYDSTKNGWLFHPGISTTGNVNANNNLYAGNNVFVGSSLHLADLATTEPQANGVGITLGSNYAIANILYDSTKNGWLFHPGISTTGNVKAGNLIADVNIIANGNLVAKDYVVGNLIAPGGNTQVLYNRDGIIGASPSDFSYNESTQTLYVTQGSFSGNLITGTEAIYAGTAGYTVLGSDLQAQFTGNVDSYTQINFQNISNSATASGDYIITADNGNDLSYYLDLGMTSSNWNGTQPNSLENKLGPNQGYLYVKDGNLAIGTLTNSGSNVWTFDTTGNLTTPGSIIPDTSNVYSLGNATNQWLDLYVSNTTIYINNVPIGLTSSNILTVNGQAVLSDGSDTSVSTTGNIAATEFLGNISSSNVVGAVANAAYAADAGTAWSVSAANVSGLSNVATSGEYSDLANAPTNLNQFTNGPGYITTATANVVSVNGKTGVVTVSEYSNAAVADYLNSGSFTGDISTTGNISGGNLYTAGTLTSGPQNITGNVNITGNITVTQGNLYYDQVYDLVVGDPLIYVGANNTGNVYDLGMVVSYDDGTYQHGGWVRDASDGTWKLFGNVVTEPTTTIDFANAIYQPMQAGAIIATSGSYSQTLSAAGNVIGNYILGNINQATGGYGNANVVANLAALSSNPVSTTGNVTGGNLLTGGLISATGVIRTADGMTATSNITGGNLLTSGIVSATSDVFAGSGQFRTTATTANIVNSTPTTVNIAGGANIAVNIGNAQGVVSLSGNVQGSTNGFAIGYRDIPQVSMIANATINLTDAGKHYYSTSASNLVLTIANNSSQAFTIGSAINIINRGTGTMTIARAGGVSLYLAGNATSADRTLSSYGAATIQKVESDTWFIVGVGLT